MSEQTLKERSLNRKDERKEAKRRFKRDKIDFKNVEDIVSITIPEIDYDAISSLAAFLVLSIKTFKKYEKKQGDEQ